MPIRVTLTVIKEQERTCHRCHKPIKIGAKAVKSHGFTISCPDTEIYVSWHHEKCWKP